MSLRIYDRRHSIETARDVPDGTGEILTGQVLDSYVPFNSQHVYEWMTTANVRTLMPADIGPAFLPFDRCWFEWVSPMTNDRESPMLGEAVDAGVIEKELRDGRSYLGSLFAIGTTSVESGSTQIAWRTGCVGRSGRIQLRPVIWIDTLNDSGTITESTPLVYGSTDAVVELVFELYGFETRYATWVARLSAAFSNLRNADVELEPERTVTKRERKLLNDRKLRRFRIIHIPGTNRGGGTSGGTRDTPAHLVRGHFKTYTPDRPLFGQHVGTYWWSWHGRGDEAHGSVDHKYVVHP